MASVFDLAQKRVDNWRPKVQDKLAFVVMNFLKQIQYATLPHWMRMLADGVPGHPLEVSPEGVEVF